METIARTLYDTDFAEWAAHTAELLRARRFDEVELEQLAEEVEDLGKSERSAVRSQLHRMIMHLVKDLVKETMQPERRGKSWRSSISNARTEIRFKIADSPSFAAIAGTGTGNSLPRRRKRAVYEMGLPRARQAEIPERCPYTLQELLEGDPQPWR